MPLLLIVSLGYELFNIVIEKTDTINNHIKKIIGKVIAAVAIFFLPLIISLVLMLASGTRFQENECWKNANKETIAKYKAEEEAREEEERRKREEEKEDPEDEGEEEEETGTETETEEEEEETGTPLNLKSSFKMYYDNTYSMFIGYYLYIPKNATTNMPLIVMFPPNSLAGDTMLVLAQTKNLDKLKAFIYIPILAHTEYPKKDWNPTASNQAVKKINDLVKEYKLDANRISLTAFSSSAYYIYQTANDYRIFSGIAPISSGVNFNIIKNYYKDWQYLKTLPMKGYGEYGGDWSGDKKINCKNIHADINWSAYSSMCTVVKGLGKCSSCDNNCDSFTYLPEACHGTIGKYVFSTDKNKNGVSDIFDWMIAQKKK